LATLALATTLTGCGKKAPVEETRPSAQKTGDYGDNPNLPAEPAAGEPGGPLPGLSAEDLERFRKGRIEFWRTYTIEDGLGPHYNDVRCAGCHSIPVLGGAGSMDKAARVVFQPPDFVEVWPLKAIDGFEPLKIPSANVIKFRRPTSLLGLGLIEGIPDATMEANCGRPETADGVRYRLNRAWDGRPGRIGSKAHNSTIVDFSASAITSEMGITNPLKRDPRFKTDKDEVADPEAPAERIESISTFIRLLAPPPRATGSDESAGEKVFHAIGCGSCHMADPHPTAKGAYSDLCIHDLGPALDAQQPDFLAAGADWRTAPLWGLRWKRAYLHDERATSLHEAIVAHQGESRVITKRYSGLPEAERAALQRFLQTL